MPLLKSAATMPLGQPLVERDSLASSAGDDDGEADVDAFRRTHSDTRSAQVQHRTYRRTALAMHMGAGCGLAPAPSSVFTQEQMAAMRTVARTHDAYDVGPAGGAKFGSTTDEDEYDAGSLVLKSGLLALLSKGARTIRRVSAAR